MQKRAAVTRQTGAFPSGEAAANAELYVLEDSKALLGRILVSAFSSVLVELCWSTDEQFELERLLLITERLLVMFLSDCASFSPSPGSGNANVDIPSFRLRTSKLFCWRTTSWAKGNHMLHGARWIGISAPLCAFS